MSINEHGHSIWKNVVTGLDSYSAAELAGEYFRKLRNQRPSGFVNTALVGLGYTDEEMISASDTTAGSEDYLNRFSTRREIYWKCLENE